MTPVTPKKKTKCYKSKNSIICSQITSRINIDQKVNAIFTVFEKCFNINDFKI